MEQQIRSIINDVFYDLQACAEEMGETLDAEGLADCVGDRMFDDCPEYRNMPYEQRRALVVNICKQYA
jgi:hypothetical protein